MAFNVRPPPDWTGLTPQYDHSPSVLPLPTAAGNTTSCTLENPSVVAQENDTPSLSASSSQTTESAPSTVTRAPAVENHKQSATVPELSAQDIGSGTNDLLAASTVGLPQRQTESPEAPAAEHQPHSPAASPPPELSQSSDKEDAAVADVFPCGGQEDGAANGQQSACLTAGTVATRNSVDSRRTMQSSDDTSDYTGTCSNDSFAITVDSHATTSRRDRVSTQGGT